MYRHVRDRHERRAPAGGPGLPPAVAAGHRALLDPALSNGEFITVMSKTPPGRAPYAAGPDYWPNELTKWATRDAVPTRFIVASEYDTGHGANSDFVEARNGISSAGLPIPSGGGYGLVRLGDGIPRDAVTKSFIDSVELACEEQPAGG